jgi:DNA helicase-2/ATP-dependent DNA helicase PcrA
MKERVEKALGNTEARNLYIGTFHSVFARILRAEAAKLGYPKALLYMTQMILGLF